MTTKQIAVRLPRLLDKDLWEVRRLLPRTQSIEQNITPLSTASLTLDDGSGVPIRSFIELYNAKGSAGIYRVCLPDESFGSGEHIKMEHGICTLDDAILPGQGTLTGTPRRVLSQILSHQTTKARGQNMWTLGVVEAPESMEISVDYDGTKTLEMLTRAVNSMDGYMLSFSQASFPWIVHVLKKPENVSCEGRLSRNIRTIRKTVDDSELCTRLYCNLLPGGYIESDTVSAWGVVEKGITLNDSMASSDVMAYCRRYLDNRKNPVISIEIDANEWFVMTGERIDRFEIGDICRIALPDYGVVIEERIVALNYMDALGKPEAVTVSLANQITDMSIKTAESEQSVNSLQSTSTSYGNRITTSETKITNLKDTQEGIEELNGKMTHWFNSVEIDLDAEEASIGLLASRSEVTAVSQRLSSAEIILNGDDATIGLVAQVEENIGFLTEQEKRITQAEIDIDGANANIALKASATTVDALGKRVSSAEIEIDGLNSEIELKADKITLNGYVTANQLESEIADLNLSMSETIVTNYLTVKSRATLDALALDGENISLSSATFLTSSTSLTVNSTGGTVTGVTLNKKTSTIYYLDWD